MIGFTKEELSRYSRHFLLKECGVEGQNRIRRGRVLIVGAGGLGSPVALYLAAAGVGTIGIADGDVVDLSNLQRQVIHTTADVGRPKVESACERIKAINPHVIAEPICDLLNEANAADIIRNYDFIVDATDNFAAKMLINDTCVTMEKPFFTWRHIAFRGTYVHVGARLGLLPLYFRRGTSARCRAAGCGNRCFWGHCRHTGHHSGGRGIEVSDRYWTSAYRQSAYFRCKDDGFRKNLCEP